MSTIRRDLTRPFTDAIGPNERRRPLLTIDASDVRMALEAGFTKEEVAFMLDLDEPAPDAEVDSEDLESLGAYAIRIVE